MKLGISKKVRSETCGKKIYGRTSRFDHDGDDLYAGNHEWHDWYAWRPVMACDVAAMRRHLVWRETVQCRRKRGVAGTELSGVDTGYWVYKLKTA
jgi:hypothetical protein